jgi:cytoskeleton protein RodZ
MDIGVEFRAIRESRGLTIDAIAAATRITPRMIEALERNDLNALPPRPYARGFVAAYGRELGLDPKELVPRYFAQFQAAPAAAVRQPAAIAERGQRTWRLPFAVAAVLVAAALTVPLISRWRSAPPVEPEARGTSGVASVPAAIDASTAAASRVAPPAPPALVPGELVIVLTFEGRCWVTASADGARVLYQTMEPGSTQTLRARREINLRLGDSGVVRWSVNGRAATIVGRPGEVRTITVPANSAVAAR